MEDRLLPFIVDELVNRQGCHTVILYGSRSRGDWTEESDYDVAGFRAGGGRFRDARLIEGRFLDAFVYPEADVAGNEHEFLRLREGRILIEGEGSFGSDLLTALDRLHAQGPRPLSEDEARAVRAWPGKMVARAAKGDLEGDYRRAWLQFQLLEDYFALRGEWYEGPKRAFQWLAKHDPSALALFRAALEPGAGLRELERLAEKVVS